MSVYCFKIAVIIVLQEVCINRHSALHGIYNITLHRQFCIEKHEAIFLLC